MKVNILNTAQLNADNESFRLDSEHYTKWNLDLRKKLEDIGSKELSNFIKSKVVTGHTPSMKNESYYGGDIKFIKTDNLREFYVSDGFSHYLSPKGDEKINRSSLKERDVILTIIGATYDIVGRTSLITKKALPSNINQNIAIVRLKETLPPELLVVYLNTNYGRGYLWYLSRQTEQVNLNCREVEKLLVPPFGEVFQNAIKSIVVESYAIRDRSDSVYSNSEKILLSELGLLDWKPKHALSFVRNYSETEKAGRFDAEYFQPKYDEIVKAIKNYKGGWDTLGNLVSVKKCVEVGSGEYLDEGIPFVRVSNLSPFEITEVKYISEKLYSELTEHQPKQGEILLSKDATPGIAHYLQEKLRKMIPSGGILRLRLKDNRVNEEYLTLVLNSLITKEQINRDVGGSVILHWRPDQVKQTLIPVADKKIQNQIQRKITESFNLRKQSKHLLECAKKAVEMAIERDEKTAMEWIEEQGNFEG